jgi:peptidyl-prolyl cis-trans isomerase B (cyclophilin B)
VRALTATLALLLVLVLAACGGEDEEDPVELTTVPTETETAPAPETETQAEESGGCRQVEAPEAGEEGSERKPRKKLEAGVTYEATVKTNCGAFTIELDSEGAPNVSASFVQLGEKGFYDGTIFHRIVPGFVIQGGDPTGTGTGGPGYSTVDEPPSDARYTKGVVAMAKTATEPPGTAGSQFFVVVGEDVGLPPEYAVLGKVTDGLDVVERIGQLGDPSTEQPTQTVRIESVEIRKR